MALNFVEVQNIHGLFGHDCEVIQSASGKYLRECSGQWHTLDSGRICLLTKGNFRFITLYKYNMAKGYICEVKKELFSQTDERFLQFKSEGGQNVALYFDHKNEFKKFVDALPKHTVTKNLEKRRPRGGKNADIGKPTLFQHLVSYEFDPQKQLMVVKSPAESAATGQDGFSVSDSILPRSSCDSESHNASDLANRPLPEIPRHGSEICLENHPQTHEPLSARPLSESLPRPHHYKGTGKQRPQSAPGTITLSNISDPGPCEPPQENVYITIDKDLHIKQTSPPAVTAQDPIRSLAKVLNSGVTSGFGRSPLRQSSCSSLMASPAAADAEPEGKAVPVETRAAEETSDRADEKNPAETEQNSSPVTCPICMYLYPSWLVEEHASTCEEYSTDEKTS